MRCMAAGSARSGSPFPYSTAECAADAALIRLRSSAPRSFLLEHVDDDFVGRIGLGARHRRRHPAADARCDPAGVELTPLPGRSTTNTPKNRCTSARTKRLASAGPAHRVARTRPRLHLSGLHRARLWLPSPPRRIATGPTADKQTSTDDTSRLRSTQPDGQTRRLGAPENAKTAAPNGSHHRTSTQDNHR